MKKRAVRLFLSILICVSIVPTYGAVDEDVKFRMICSDTELLIGETTTVYVQAWVDSVYGTTGNGLDTWQMDLGVDTSGVIGITETGGDADIFLTAPDPDPMWSDWASVNTPVTGEASEIAVSQVVLGASSATGVGGYSEIFSFQIEGLAEGTATYSIMDDGGGLFAYLAGDEWFENGAHVDIDGGVYFDALGSDNVFTVVPEPCSLMIMSGLSLIAFRRRRRLS